MTSENIPANEPIPPKTLAEFLESTPPGVNEEVSDAVTDHPSYASSRVMSEPDLQLYCPHNACQGLRFFRCTSDWIYVNSTEWQYGFATYVCRNCQQTSKIYALGVIAKGQASSEGTVHKFGELPSFGPPTPARVISLIGPNRELYLQGRRAENQGLGMGAFAYYRRVVENQKGRIIREMGSVARKLGASDRVVREFEAAASETQFTTAIDRIKDAIPQSLLISGHNPLTLLHKALSEGLHEQDDAVCLELAHSIRIVLTELADRMSQVLRDQAELDAAVNRLLNRKQKQGSGSPGDPTADAEPQT
jgi:hypothetical protein